MIIDLLNKIGFELMNKSFYDENASESYRCGSFIFNIQVEYISNILLSKTDINYELISNRGDIDENTRLELRKYTILSSDYNNKIIIREADASRMEFILKLIFQSHIRDNTINNILN